MNFPLRRYRFAAFHELPVVLLLLPLILPLQAQQATDADPPTASDPKEIVRRSVEVDKRAVELARNYTYQKREVKKHLGSHGEVKSTVVKTWDVTNLYGEPYSRLIQKDDKPLSLIDEKKRRGKGGKVPA